MDTIEQFKREMESLLQLGSSLTQIKLELIIHIVTNASPQHAPQIVESVERFSEQCASEAKYTALYIIDAILHHSKIKFGSQDVYTSLFSTNLPIIVTNLFLTCLTSDKVKFIDILYKWQKESFFSNKVIEPLLQLTSAFVSLSNSIQQNLQPSSSNVSGDNLSSAEYSETGNCTPTQDESPYFHEYLATKRNTNENAFAANGPHTGTNMFSNETQLTCDYNQSWTPEEDYILKEPKQDYYPTYSSYYDLSQLSGTSYAYFNPEQRTITNHLNSNNVWQTNSNARSTDYSHYGHYHYRSQRGRMNRSRSRSRSPHSFRRFRNHEMDPSDPSGRQRSKKNNPSRIPDHLTLFSTTLWIGHLPHTINTLELADVFSTYGPVANIVAVRDKFCAFVSMKHRGAAENAYDKLFVNKRLTKLYGDKVKLAWAPGKGLKTLEKYRDYWDYITGCAYVPHACIQSKGDLAILQDGSFIDELSIPINLKDTISSTDDTKQSDLTVST